VTDHPIFGEILDANDQTEARLDHLAAMRELVGNVYPNKFVRSQITGAEDTITGLLNFAPVQEATAEIREIVDTLAPRERPPAELKDTTNAKLKEFGTVRIAGRLTTPLRGSFVHLTDGISKLQVYGPKKDGFALIKNDAENSVDAENGWKAFSLLDHGDFIGVEGYLFITNTGELSVHIEKFQFLAKALLPMPDKMQGIADPEIRQRQRYADLIAGSLKVEREPGELTTREVFERRSKIIREMRRFLDDHGYIEVETPMLTAKATGAAAKPFETYHNALDIPLYARIAPELYLKRLTVGGFEKVYELNRNFRNEGISYKHNPEFTMLEFYAAYMDVNGMMDFSEELIRQTVIAVTGGTVVEFDGKQIDFGKRFERLTMKEAIVKYWSSVDALGPVPHDRSWMSRGKFEESWLENPDQVRYLAAFSNNLGNSEYFLRSIGVGNVAGRQNELVVYAAEAPEIAEQITQRFVDGLNEESFETREVVTQRLIVDIFEQLTEYYILQPTFIVDYPKSISPLSKASPTDSTVAERFELFIAGAERANGFSELNDPQEQYDRFLDQAQQRESGDEEAMVLDEDYIRALAYGMPPAAGIGIGVDRLVMLLTNRRSIRDVILFPHLRPERKKDETPASPHPDDKQLL
jgi:lysyl-tRNA synthetase class 2